jgi:hypothetical protein
MADFEKEKVSGSGFDDTDIGRLN